MGTEVRGQLCSIRSLLPPLHGLSLYPLNHLSSPKCVIKNKKQKSTPQHNMNSLGINKTLRRRPDVNPKHCQLLYWELKNKNKQTKNTSSLVSCRDWHAETAFQQQWPRSSVAECPPSTRAWVQSRKKGGWGQGPSPGFFIMGAGSVSPLPLAGCRTTFLLQGSYRVHFRPSVSPRETLRLFHSVEARGLFGERKETNLWPEPLRSWDSRSQHETTEIIAGEEGGEHGDSARSRQARAVLACAPLLQGTGQTPRTATLTSTGPSAAFLAAFSTSTRTLLRVDGGMMGPRS